MKDYIFVHEEANFAAMNVNGQTWEYKDKPSRGKFHFSGVGNKWLTLTNQDPKDWRDSLTERKTEKQEFIEKATAIINYTGLTKKDEHSRMVAEALYIAGLLKESN